MDIMTTRTFFFNSISTGCSCCSSENFCEGPFETLEDALTSAIWHRKHCTLSSHFSPNGEQNTYQADCRIFYPGTDGEEDRPIILLPGGIYIEGDFGGHPLPADACNPMEYLGPA